MLFQLLASAISAVFISQCAQMYTHDATLSFSSFDEFCKNALKSTVINTHCRRQATPGLTSRRLPPKNPSLERVKVSPCRTCLTRNETSYVRRRANVTR